jgi:hypothetical protein
MGYAKRIGRVAALAVVLAGAVMATGTATGYAAPTDSGSTSGSCANVSGDGSDVSSAAEDDILNALEEFLAGIRKAVVPIAFNRRPVATPQQVTVAPGGTVGPVPFDAYDPDGNKMTFKVNKRGTPGGPKHGTVAVDQETASFCYTADPGFTQGSDTFTVRVNDDTDLHAHFFTGFLGPFHGHDDVATVTVFAGESPTQQISGDFSVLTYNIAGLPFPLSSAIYPRYKYTTEIGKRINAFDVVNVQEDFAYNDYLIEDSKLSWRTAPQPSFLYPIGVPFSDGLNTLAEFKVKRVDRRTWYKCTADNCLTAKGFTYSQLQLPGGETIDFYNLHANTNGGPVSADNMAQLANYIQRNSEGRAVIVTGDTNLRYSDDHTLLRFEHNTGLTDAWVQLENGRTEPPFSPTCDDTDKCELLDKIFYRSGQAVTLQATSYHNERARFLNSDGKPLSDHNPPAVTFHYIAANPARPN